MSTALAAAGVAVAGLGAVSGAYGQLQYARAQRQVGELNAQVAERNGWQAQLAVADQLEQLSTRTEAILSKQKAGFAKAGVTREGSVLDVMNETIRYAHHEAFRITETGRLAQESATMQAIIARYTGAVGVQQGQIGAASTLLSGAGRGITAYQLGQSGVAPVTSPPVAKTSPAPSAISTTTP